jgi:hypothetical protein
MANSDVQAALHTVQQKAHELRSAIVQWQNFLEQGAVKLALLAVSVPYEGIRAEFDYTIEQVDKVISQVKQYLDYWWPGTDAVDKAAKQWAQVESLLAGVPEACQPQVNMLTDYWTGTSADIFSKYTTGMLSCVNGTKVAAGSVYSDLTQLRQCLADIQTAIANTANNEVINAIQLAIDVTSTAIDKVNLLEAGEAVAGVVTEGTTTGLAITQYVLAVLKAITDNVATALRELNGLAGKIRNELSAMKSLAEQMSAALSSNVRPDRVPPEPAGLTSGL